MKYKLRKRLSSPKGYQSLSLFEFCVNKLIQKMCYDRYPQNFEEGPDKYKSHIQWANIIFGSGNDVNKEYLSKVKSNFGTYFINEGYKYGWNFEKIYEEHPSFFQGDQIISGKKNKEGNVPEFTEMYEAIDHEIAASKEDARANIIPIISLEKIKLQNGTRVYVAKLDIQQDEDPKLVEDLPISIKIGGLQPYDTKVLDYDKLSNKLYFQLNKNLLNLYGWKSVHIDASWILEKMKERLDHALESNFHVLPISKFFDGKVEPTTILSEIELNEETENELDESQFEAFQFSISHDISLIWGPPGTGKSHTLAHIIDYFFKKSERTIVTCIANVAVDSLTLKLIDLLDRQGLEVKPGEVLRIGHTRDRKLLATDYLFPHNQKTKQIREIILKIDKELKTARRGEKLELRTARQNLREQLKDEVTKLISNSIITFATSSKFYVDSILNEREYDNLVIDEASMMSIPHFLALGLTIKKRIIVVGDFRQLGPVVLSQSEASKKWLHRDIFEYSGIDPKQNNIEHPALKQLLIQRRSNEKICNLTNSQFYGGKLVTKINKRDDGLINISPFEGKIISYKRLDERSIVVTTEKGSRKNPYSAQEVVKILDTYSQQSNLRHSIGIVTPYRAQVKLIQEFISQKGYTSNFLDLIKVGTVHAFQGSESDLIIFDCVDSLSKQIGKLYKFETGKRLVNVAMSRAKSKLIVIGDHQVFTSGKGYTTIDSSIKNIFKKLNATYKIE